MPSNKNTDSPWNPDSSISISPEDYEKQVVEWLRNSESGKLLDFDVTHRKMTEGAAGEYEIDAVAEYSIFNGAKIRVLVECKRYKNPVSRDLILTLWAKVQDISANKGMIFSTSGFQSGALEFAEEKNIATITFVGDDFTYNTKSLNGKAKPPPWLERFDYCGLFLSINGDKISKSRIDNSRLDELSIWLKSGV